MENLTLNEEFVNNVKLFNDFVLSKRKKGINDNLLITYVIKNKLKEHKCCNCNSDPIWLNKPLNFILDRIDNDLNNNTIENLRLLCPNCYCQLRKKYTLLQKNTTKPKTRCIDCNKLLKNNSRSCQIKEEEKDSRAKREYAQTFRCKTCLEKQIFNSVNIKLI